MSEQCSVFGRINILRQALTSDKNKVAFLLGAGCPLSICLSDGKPLISDIKGLTSAVCEKLNESEIRNLKDGITLPPGKEPTIEDILSRIRLLMEVVGGDTFNGFDLDALRRLEKMVCKEITETVNKELPIGNTPYHNLASWIGGIHRENPVEIFTPNYDLLIESSLESINIPYFDGFIGSKDAFFDLHSMEHERLPSRWARLWKLHGSINWWSDKNGRVFRGHSKDANNDKQMIYPSHLKYSQSRRMPYLAMQDRLSSFLSEGQAVLVICGYSFVDQHLNETIVQKLSVNPRAICFGLLYDDISKYPEAVECANKATNLMLISKDAAFFAGEKKSWKVGETSNQYSYLVDSTENIIKCNLGNFAVFCQFLLKQTGEYESGVEEQNEN